MSDSPLEIVKSRCVEFPAGSVTIYHDGSARFHFRHMDFVFEAGSDSASDGMEVRVSAEVTNAIKSLFEREYWP